MRGDIDSPEEIENEKLRKDEEEALVELERFEEAETKEEIENAERGGKSIAIAIQYAEPDPKLLSDRFNLGRIVTYWHMKTLMENEGYDLNKVNFDELVDLFKKELNDSKLYEDYKRRFSDAMRQDEENQKYV